MHKRHDALPLAEKAARKRSRSENDLELPHAKKARTEKNKAKVKKEEEEFKQLKKYSIEESEESSHSSSSSSSKTKTTKAKAKEKKESERKEKKKVKANNSKVGSESDTSKERKAVEQPKGLKALSQAPSVARSAPSLANSNTTLPIESSISLTQPIATIPKGHVEFDDDGNPNPAKIIHTSIYLKAPVKKTVEGWERTGWRVDNPARDARRNRPPKQERIKRKRNSEAGWENPMEVGDEYQSKRALSHANEPSFEALPKLERNPKEGDLIAFKILEVNERWTPEVSDWKAAKVLAFDEGLFIIFFAFFPYSFPNALLW